MEHTELSIQLGDCLYEHKRTENSLETHDKRSDWCFLHSHEHYEIVYCISGRVQCTVGGQSHPLQAGDLLVSPSHMEHRLVPQSGDVYERIVISVPPTEQHKRLLSAAFGEDAVKFCASTELASFFTRLEDYCRNLCGWQFELLAPTLLNELLCICSTKTAFKVHEEADTEGQKILDAALAYINENLTTIVDVEEIASHVFVSSSYIYQLFHRKLHTSPKKLLTAKRLLLANDQILQGASPSTVYLKCGFRDYCTFYRSYKGYFGHSPKNAQKE